MPDITIAGKDGDFSAYLASPASGTGPGILVIQEIFGVNKDMRDHCDGLAKQGYFALSPDLFWRQEPGVQITDKTDAEWQKAFQLYQGFSVDKGIEDLQASLRHLRTIKGCTGKAGTVGFCLGGLLAYLMATRSDADGNVGYYGVGIDGKLDEAARITKPLMLHIAEEDKFVSKDAQKTIKAGLAGNAKVTVYSYPGADHAFARHNGVHYHQASAELASRRTAEFFKAHLS
ncbi:MAG: dienelactone hydrolase family protein [Gammaproteobacteria bacterium]